MQCFELETVTSTAQNFLVIMLTPLSEEISSRIRLDGELWYFLEIHLSFLGGWLGHLPSGSLIPVVKKSEVIECFRASLRVTKCKRKQIIWNRNRFADIHGTGKEVSFTAAKLC